MAGFERKRFVVTSEEELQEFLCTICHSVFNNPVFSQCCGQTYCKDCITEWLNDNNTCPIDRKRLRVTQLLRPPNAFLNLLNELRIKCDFESKGCKTIVGLFELSVHSNRCEFNPKNYCNECQIIMIRDEHNCIENFKRKYNTIKEEMNGLREENKKLKTNECNNSVSNDRLNKEMNGLREENKKLKTNECNNSVTNKRLNELINGLKEEINKLKANERTSTLAMNLNARTSQSSSESLSDNTSEENNISKVPTAPAINRERLNYTGFEAIESHSSLKYSLSSFKPIAGPKSKSSQTVVIGLKAFQHYLFASFMDCSVRRYHFEDKINVITYEGHEGLVFAMIIVQCLKSADTFILYTGGRDRKLRAFDTTTGVLLNCLELSHEIFCLDHNWSHVFAGLHNGMVCKVEAIHEISSEFKLKQVFGVNSGQRICAIISVKPVYSIDTNIEPLITVSSNKLRVINTNGLVRDEERVLHSIPVQFSDPIFVRTFRNYLFVSHNLPIVRNEDKTKVQMSKVVIYDLLKDWTPIRTIDVLGRISSLDLNQNDLVVSSDCGKIQCIECTKLELKWIAYSSRVSACVGIGDRLVLGNDSGLIDVIYLDQKMMECDGCGMPCARHIDLKEHIKLEHKVPESAEKEDSAQQTLMSGDKKALIDSFECELNTAIADIKTIVTLSTPIVFRDFQKQMEETLQRWEHCKQHGLVPERTLPRRLFPFTPELKALINQSMKTKIKLFQKIESKNESNCLRECLYEFLKKDIKPIFPKGWMSLEVLKHRLKWIKQILPPKAPNQTLHSIAQAVAQTPQV